MMRRSIRAIPLLLLAATALAPGASAGGSPPAPFTLTETFAAGEACQFPIEVLTVGKSGVADLPSNPRFFGISTSPGLRITVTNLSDPDNAVTVNATGAFRFVALSGDDFKIVAGGHNFIYGFPSAGATALSTTGPIELTIVNGLIAQMDLSGARVRDLCAELA